MEEGKKIEHNNDNKHNWGNKNSIKIDPKKMEFMLFYSQRTRLQILETEIMVRWHM